MSRYTIPPAELEFTFVRSSGPGGQNVNKVNTKAVLRWAVKQSRSIPEPVRQRFLTRYARRITVTGDVLVTSQRFRDQGRNAADCMVKLQQLLDAVAAEPVKRKATKPSRGAVVRRRESKRLHSRKKQTRRHRPIDE
jgi:ribosome-associated protein